MAALERLTPLYCFGESHCLRFRGLLHRSKTLPNPLHAQARFLPHVRAETFMADGGLHPDLAAALIATELCTLTATEDGDEEVLGPAHQARNPKGQIPAARHAALAGEPLLAPALLLFAGDMELQGLLAQIGPGVDFELPEDTTYGVAAGSYRIPFDCIELALTRWLRPFADGLALLLEAGFTRTMVHGLPPRVKDDHRAAKWCGNSLVPASVRAKVTVAANRLLRQRCERLGVGFIDIWPDITTDGHLHPDFNLDDLFHGRGGGPPPRCHQRHDQSCPVPLAGRTRC